MSNLPNSLMVFSTRDLMCSSLFKSVIIVRILLSGLVGLDLLISFLAFSRFSFERLQIITFTPSLYNPLAHANPNPLLDARTKATLLFKPKSMLYFTYFYTNFNITPLSFF